MGAWLGGQPQGGQLNLMCRMNNVLDKDSMMPALGPTPSLAHLLSSTEAMGAWCVTCWVWLHVSILPILMDPHPSDVYGLATCGTRWGRAPAVLCRLP